MFRTSCGYDVDEENFLYNRKKNNKLSFQNPFKSNCFQYKIF